MGNILSYINFLFYMFSFPTSVFSNSNAAALVSCYPSVVFLCLSSPINETI